MAKSIYTLVLIFFLHVGSFAEIRVGSLSADRVCADGATETALIVIDMQSYFVTRGGNHEQPENAKKIDAVILSQIDAIRRAREKDIPIIFIEYATPYADLGETSSRLKDEVKKYKKASVVQKRTDGMFEDQKGSRVDLKKIFQKENVGTLIIAGANGGACVQASIEGALNGKCNVRVFSEGVADFNYEEFIYPYRGHYDSMKAICPTCEFVEIDKAKDLFSSPNEQKPNEANVVKSVTSEKKYEKIDKLEGAQ